MFDPLSVAIEIKYPWRNKPSEFFPKGYRDTFITIWHKDPCSDGSDNSCDWFGQKKRSPKLDALGEAIRRLETVLDNRPFYPDHEGHIRFQPVKDAYWQLKKKTRLRWHPRYHFWHWRIQIHPWQKLYRWAFERCTFCRKGFKWNEQVIGSWSGSSIWHFGCDHNTHKPPTKGSGDE
jgi:hypothetical protein